MEQDKENVNSTSPQADEVPNQEAELVVAKSAAFDSVVALEKAKKEYQKSLERVVAIERALYAARNREAPR